MQYRRLTTDELQEMTTEFVRFLATNQVTAPEWEQLKRDGSPRVEELIEQFSELVFERILQKVEYLEHRAPKDLRTYHCLPDKLVMLGIRVEGSSNLDFTKNESPELMLAQMKLSEASLQLYRGEKAYEGPREHELFRMLESGALISRDGAMYKLLEGLAPG